MWQLALQHVCGGAPEAFHMFCVMHIYCRCCSPDTEVLAMPLPAWRIAMAGWPTALGGTAVWAAAHSPFQHRQASHRPSRLWRAEELIPEPSTDVSHVRVHATDCSSCSEGLPMGSSNQAYRPHQQSRTRLKLTGSSPYCKLVSTYVTKSWSCQLAGCAVPRDACAPKSHSNPNGDRQWALHTHCCRKGTDDPVDLRWTRLS